MKQRLTWYRGLILTVMAVMPCSAALHLVTAPGTAAPPPTLGGYPMYAFPTDGRAEYSMVSDVPFWNGGTMNLATESELARIGSGWSTWSHGYTGEVYWVDGLMYTQQVLQFPAGLNAFYMYLEPNFKMDSFQFEVQAGTETTLLTIAGNGGAQYVGVYSDDINGFLTSLVVQDLSQGDSEGFAIGEFASNVRQTTSGIPEPGSMVALGCVLAAGLMRRNRTAR